jgi:ribonuclease Z
VLQLAGWSVDAVSVGGFETCIRLPAMQLCFDIGRCPPAAVEASRVLFTHAHVDHMGGVIHHCAQRDLSGRGAPEYWVPAESAEAFEEMLQSWRRLSHSALPCRVRAVRPGDRVPIGGGRVVEVFRAVHRIPTVGYALHVERRRLRADLVGLSGPEIAARREAGEVVHEVFSVPEVAFCGDTTIDVFDREPIVRKVRLLILEVTFFGDRVSVQQARGGGHVHFDEVVERLDRFDNEVVLLTHASRRHHSELRALFEQGIPAAQRAKFRVLEPGQPWVSGPT